MRAKLACHSSGWAASGVPSPKGVLKGEVGCSAPRFWWWACIMASAQIQMLFLIYSQYAQFWFYNKDPLSEMCSWAHVILNMWGCSSSAAVVNTLKSNNKILRQSFTSIPTLIFHWKEVWRTHQNVLEFFKTIIANLFGAYELNVFKTTVYQTQLASHIEKFSRLPCARNSDNLSNV